MKGFFMVKRDKDKPAQSLPKQSPDKLKTVRDNRLDTTAAVIIYSLSSAMFPSPCVEAHFEVSHQKRVMKPQKIREKTSLNSQKSFFGLFQVFFDLCEKKSCINMNNN